MSDQTVQERMERGENLNIVLFYDGEWMAYLSANLDRDAEIVEDGSGPHGALEALLCALAPVKATAEAVPQ